MKINRSNIQIKANPKRVILNFLQLGLTNNSGRGHRLIGAVLSIPEAALDPLYREIRKEFASRHRNFDNYIDDNFEKVRSAIPNVDSISPLRKKVLGAYFSKEYSIQSAALFNPSMVAHPNQEGVKAGEKRFIISLRSVGEGHISSIEFRSGIVNAAGEISLDKETGFASRSHKEWNKIYHKKNLLKNTAVLDHFDQNILHLFKEEFTYNDYLKKADSKEFSYFDLTSRETLCRILDTNYDVIADAQSSICERVIFPNAAGESMGMEDVRFVAFTENGGAKYIGTYTAYNGHEISPQLIITDDFVHFKVRTMFGDAVNDKGMALFPEKINGQFAMIGRQGGEDLSIMYSDDLMIWKDYKVIMSPQDIWGYVQIGNCGSPIKTREGWLLITHAVGPLRKYVLSAILLDLKDPGKIIKKLNRPLLSPNAEEREGYVPNVVYSCGSMLHNDDLIVPYAMSDYASTYATVNVRELLNELKNSI